jgi:hypothetical protein
LLLKNRFYHDNVKFDEDICERYRQVLGWDPRPKFLHSFYLHSLVFPPHIKMFCSLSLFSIDAVITRQGSDKLSKANQKT